VGLLFLIDGPHVLHRASHAQGELAYERWGVQHRVGGCYGFLQMIRLAHMRLGDGDAMTIVAWEDPERNHRSYRRSLYPEYKRRPQPDEVNFGTIDYRTFVREQQELLSPLLASIGVPQAHAPWYEADDVLATLSAQAGDHQVVVFTGDKDMFTLVTDRVGVMRPLKEGYQLLTPEVWAEEHSLAPSRWPEVLALMGDDSDNIPGVMGIGPAKAEKLIGEHGSLEGVIEAAQAGRVKRFSEGIVKGGVQHKGIKAMADQLRLNLKLTTLDGQVDLAWTRPQRDERKVAQAFREMKFHSFTSHPDLQSVLAMGTDAW
jgi:DNA polymerase I